MYNMMYIGDDPMNKKIRKQIYILPDQERQLKRISESRGLSEAEIIRQAISAQVSRFAPIFRDLSAWERELEFIQSLIDRGAVEGKRTWTRADLYDE